MRRKNITNAIIRESITQALLILMRETPFEGINITDIVKKAGVSRVSFYRNFQSKEDVLVSKLDEAAMEWWMDYNAHGHTDYALGVFQHCLSVKEILLLVYRQGLAHLLWRNLYHLLGPEPADSEELSYKKSCLVGCLFGVLGEWIGRGMVDSPQKMSRIFDASQVDMLVKSVQAPAETGAAKEPAENR